MLKSKSSSPISLEAHEQLEVIARLASETLRINPQVQPMQSELLAKHFLRKHGPDASYGQK